MKTIIKREIQDVNRTAVTSGHGDIEQDSGKTGQQGATGCLIRVNATGPGFGRWHVSTAYSLEITFRTAVHDVENDLLDPEGFFQEFRG